MFRSLCIVSALLFAFAHKANAQCTASILQTFTPGCEGQTITLSATGGGDVYQWYLGGTPVGVNDDSLVLSNMLAGSYTVTVTVTFGTCNVTTAAATVYVQALPIAIADNNHPCVGETLQLISTTGCMGCTYTWTGPNGFTSTSQNPFIPNATPLYNGVYTLMVSSGFCMGLPSSTIVNVTPGTPVTASNNGPFCFGDTMELTANTVTGATYSWTGPGGFTSTQQNPIVVLNNTILGGIYTVNVYNGCNNTDTTAVDICNTLFLNVYNDVNSNCTYDAGTDHNPYLPTLIAVDSNTVPVDTIPATSGFYYTVNGGTGDTYTFKIISLSGDMITTCPVTGSVDHVLQPNSLNVIDMGIACSSSTNFDLSVYGSNPASSAVTQLGTIYAANTHCLPANGTITLMHSPKYQHYWSSPTPTSVSGNTITWDINSLSAANIGSAYIYYNLQYNTNVLQAGDTTHSVVTITPTTNDVNTTNNTWTKVDTVVASLDPNAITAYPEGCVTAGTKMQYTIQFENIGNAPAENIYVLDTLPAELDANTMELVMSSHTMYVTKLNDGTNTIFRFDFPNINLPDSSDHAGCHGMFVYTINSSNALPYGDSIDHRAGIYFDYNAVVMTNTARTTICVPANISVVSGSGDITLYPNPAGDELTLISNNTISNYTITNSIGQVMMEQKLNDTQARLDIHSLAPGMYYVTVKGEDTSETLKFVKK